MLAKGINVWLFIFGFTGLFIRYASQHSAIMRYVSDSSYWVYLLHLPLTAFIPGLIAGIAMPAFIIASNPADSISVFEIIGLLVWLGAFVLESVADLQKLAFLKAMKKVGKRNQVCNVGLWKYSRHPNYFAEWMVWNGLIIASIPSWIALYKSETLIVWALLGIALLFASRMMYTTLVHYTGAVPAEYYSAQKRPDYKNYQKTTNRFFPGPPK